MKVRKKDILEGRYTVYSDGRVFSNYIIHGTGKKKRLVPHEMRQALGKSRYKWLYVGGKIRRVHILVLETFIGARPKGKQAAHRNGDRLDNRLENLYWATRAENIRDKYSHDAQPIGASGPKTHLKADDVLAIMELYGRCNSLTKVADKFRVHRSTVHNIVTGKTWWIVTGIHHPKDLSPFHGEWKRARQALAEYRSGEGEK